MPGNQCTALSKEVQRTARPPLLRIKPNALLRCICRVFSSRFWVVDKDNIEQVDIEPVELCIELRIDAADMSVRIDRFERGERFHRQLHRRTVYATDRRVLAEVKTILPARAPVAWRNRECRGSGSKPSCHLRGPQPREASCLCRCGWCQTELHPARRPLPSGR